MPAVHRRGRRDHRRRCRGRLREHLSGDDIDHPPAKTVQLMPYKDTPNPGGVYKVWVTRVEDFLLGCQELGKPGTTGLDLVDCGCKGRGQRPRLHPVT